MLNQGRRRLPLYRRYPPPCHDNLCPSDWRRRNPESHALQQIRHPSLERDVWDVWTLRAGCGACAVSEKSTPEAEGVHFNDSLAWAQLRANSNVQC